MIYVKLKHLLTNYLLMNVFEFLKQFKRFNFLNPKNATKESVISNYFDNLPTDVQESCLLNLFSKFCFTKHNNIINAQFINELELFQDLRTQNQNNSILSKICFTKTISGKLIFESNICNPSLKRDFRLISKSEYDNLKCIVEKYKEIENDIIWLLHYSDIQEWTEIWSPLFFTNNYLMWMNSYEYIMIVVYLFTVIILPILSLIQPLLIVLIPYFVIRWFGINISFWNVVQIVKMLFFTTTSSIWGKFITFFVYIYGIYETCLSMYNKYDLAKKMFHKLKSLDILNNCINELQIFNLDTVHLDIYETNNLNYFEFYSNGGSLVSLFTNLKNMFPKLIQNIKVLGLADYYISIYELNKIGYSRPIFINNTKAVVRINNLFHPSLGNNSVKNSMKINNRGIIVTGSNASGKSTFIKSLMLSILMAQSIGISCCDKIRLTPFGNLTTHIHIPDIKGKESLFQSELNNCVNFINQIHKNKKLKSLIIMDEIFSSTNIYEGTATAYAICNYLGKLKNNITVITTHNDNLTNIKNFDNYYMKIDKNIIQTELLPYIQPFKFTFKIVKGINKDKIAIELLKQKNIPKSIINKAIKIFHKLTKK